MDFRMMFFLCLALFSISCTKMHIGIGEDENLIGVKVENISSLVNFEGRESNSLVVFDETRRRIHQFRISDMTHQKTLRVKKTELTHAVVAQEKGNFIIDMFEQNIVVFNKEGHAEEKLLTMPGVPVSVAFRPELNLFVVYDNLNSVGIIKFDSEGNAVGKPFIGGSFLDGAGSITSGDLLADGRLVLASESSLAIVDVERTLQGSWTFTSFSTGLGRISWLAPVRDNPQQIFVKAGNELAIFDISARVKVDSISLSDMYFEKVSKSFDAHVIVRSAKTSQELTLYYPQNSKIKSRTLQKQDAYVVSSQLHLADDRWSVITNASKNEWFDGSANRDKEGRELKMFRPSDMAALKKMPVEAKAQAVLSSASLFMLYPADFGYAAKIDILTGEEKKAIHFNFPLDN